MSAADLKKQMAEILKREVNVGWFEGNNYPNGVPVAAAAAWNEFGVTRTNSRGKPFVIPARAPMRLTMETEGSDIADDMAKTVNRCVRTGEIDQSFELFGLKTAERFKANVEKGGKGPGNALATIEGMIIGKNPDGSDKRAGSSPAKENRTFGQGKGIDRPLVDTGQMLNTLVSKVEVK